MKRITYLTLFLLIFNSIAFAQTKTPLEKANDYLATKGEVVINFKANNQSQFLELNKLLSVSHKHVDQQELEVEAYANKEQFEKFLTYGLTFIVNESDNEIPQERTQRIERKNKNGKIAASWDTTWDAYPKYSEYVAKLNYWVATYPNLCSLQNIGSTPNGRALYVLKISDNANIDETEPEFLYTSSMHGDEITGYPTMLRLIDYLLTKYGTDTEVTNIVNGTELFINPLANPDGSYKSVGNDIYNPGGATNTPTRANKNGVDLNRNYGDAIGGLHADGNAYQPETIAFMNFEQTRNFVLAANYHGGTEVFNFPWDTSYTPGTGNFSYHPHDNYFKYVSKEYASLCQTADGNLNYMDAVYNTGQFPGTTNGAAWYSVYGGRQDYNNFFNHSKESTVEISDTKTPTASNLPFYWTRNKQALLNYVKQASYGLQGVVTNADGNPIHAKVYVSGTADGWGSWVETSPTKGDYHKVQKAGTYSVIFEAAGYTTQTISVTLTDGAATVQNVTMVPTTAIPIAVDPTICQGQTVELSATGTGTINWYSTTTATTPLASSATYITPALSSTTSYYVERVLTPANIGPLTVSGTATVKATVANKYLVFDCSTPTKLKSVLITASAAGEILVELQDSTGAMLESKIVRLTTSGSQDIALDFFLPAATGLRLVSREISGFDLTCATSGITYPMTNGTVSITGNSGTGTFFQFFNWKFEPIKSNREEVIVTVNPTSVAGTVSSNQAICSNSQPESVTLTGNTGTIQWQSSTDNLTFTDITGETSNTLSGVTIGALTATKYFRAIVTSGVCSSVTSGTVTITVATTTWTGTTWSNGEPTSSTAAIIAGNYSQSANIDACTLTVNNNAVVSIPSGYNVTLNGALTVSSGSFTLENNANLIQTSNIANSGNINVKRNSSALFRLDYTMWSSPVSGSQTLGLFSPLTSTNRFYTYNTTTDVYNAISNGSPFSLAKGYLIRMPNTWVDYVAAPPSTPLSWTGTFTGIPNNGNISYNLSTAGSAFNAVGNPYPSTLNIDNFINGNTGNINGTLYFWRKRNDATNNTSYSTCTTAGCSINNSHLYPDKDFISIGQGFIVKATSTTLNFTNTMRVANTTNQFFKTKQIEKNRIWLNLLNEATPVNQMLLAYMTGATMGIDSAIDGAYINDSSTALNSLIGSEEFAVQGRALPFDGTDEVPLSFKATTPGNYSIAIDHVDGLFSGNQDIILKDNDTGRETDLKTGAYTFFAPAGLSNTRFTLKYQKTLGTNTLVFDENSIVVFKNNGYIHIKSNGKSMHNVKLFDTRGRLIAEKSKVNSNEISIESSRFANEVLIVKITSDDNKVVNKKVAN
nr:M14 family zinc carboxypeptidase [uncultured Flavobacterium sp.]